MLLHVAVVNSFSMLYNIPLNEYTRIHFIYSTVNEHWVVFSLGLLRLVLVRIFTSKSLCGYKFLFLLGKYLGMKIQDYMAFYICIRI